MEKEIMKKVLMILLSAMLVLSMAGVAAADSPSTEITGASTNNKATTTVSLGLHELYVVTLPTAIILTYDDNHKAYSGKAPYSVDITRLDTNHKLTITVSSPNIDQDKKFYLKATDGDQKIEYQLGYGLDGQHIGGSPAAYMISGSEGSLNFVNTDTDIGMTDSMYLHAKVSIGATQNVDSNKNYLDTLTFTVESLQSS